MSLLTTHQDIKSWILHDTMLFYSFSNHLQYNTAYFIVMLVIWVLGGSANTELHIWYIINASPCLFQWTTALPLDGGSLVLFTSEAMLRSLCFTPVHLTEKIIVWLIHLTQPPFISFSGLCFTGASNQCLALRSPQSSPLSYVTILFFCSIVLIPVAAPVTPHPVFSSLIFLSSVCTASQADRFTWDSSPDVAFRFHHLQIASQDEILSTWLQIQPKSNQLKISLQKCKQGCISLLQYGTKGNLKYILYIFAFLPILTTFSPL